MALFGKGKSGIIDCSVGFMLNDTPKAIQQFLKQINPILNSKPSDSWKLDLAKCQYIGPDAAVIILALARKAEIKGQTCEVIPPKKPEKLRRFCELSGLNHFLFDTPMPMDRPDSEVAPLRILDKADYIQTPVPLVRLIKKHIHISKDMEERYKNKEYYLATCLNEAVQNVQDHAQSPIGAITCARFHKKETEIRIAIVDLGLGIFTTLKKAYPDTSNTVIALRRVIQGRFTAGSRKNNLGLGLSNLAGIVRQLQGQFMIITGNAMFVQKKEGKEQYFPTRFTFPGTGVFFKLPFSDIINTS